MDVLERILPPLGLQVSDVLLEEIPNRPESEHADLKPVTIAGFTFRCVDPGMYQPFTVGDVELPVRRLMGGDGSIRYQHPDGIVCVEHATKFVLPPDIQRIASDILDRDRRNAEARRAPFVQRDVVRLDDYEPTLRDPDDAAWPLKLHVSITDFFTSHVTNAHLDEALPGGGTIRTMHAGSPNEFRRSELANPLAVNLSLVTSDGVILVAKRSERVATNPGGWAPAVSGTGNPKRDSPGGRYNPFLTAQREAGEEATKPYMPDLSEITFFGLARTLTYHHPFLFGELRTPLTARQLLSQVPSDNWETDALIPIPLAIKPVTNWIRDHYLAAVEGTIPGFGIYTAIFSLLQSLLYAFPNEWRKVVAALRLEQPPQRAKHQRPIKTTRPKRTGRR